MRISVAPAPRTGTKSCSRVAWRIAAPSRRHIRSAEIMDCVSPQWLTTLPGWDGENGLVQLDFFTLFPEAFDWFRSQRPVANAVASGSELRFFSYRATRY